MFVAAYNDFAPRDIWSKFDCSEDRLKIPEVEFSSLMQ